jgi:hypothetical protein
MAVIDNATGMRITELQLNPENVLLVPEESRQLKDGRAVVALAPRRLLDDKLFSIKRRFLRR